jgi:hypothetical protein
MEMGTVNAGGVKALFLMVVQFVEGLGSPLSITAQIRGRGGQRRFHREVKD